MAAQSRFAGRPFQHWSGKARAAPWFLACMLGAFLTVLPGCTKGDTPPFLYILNPFLVAGSARPSPPGNLAAEYNLALDLLHLTWGPSVDPDTRRETPVYRIYAYQVYPPPAFFRPEDRVGEPVVREDYLQTDHYVGLLTFVVTGYDGLAESLPSSPLTVSLP